MTNNFQRERLAELEPKEFLSEKHTSDNEPKEQDVEKIELD